MRWNPFSRSERLETRDETVADEDGVLAALWGGYASGSVAISGAAALRVPAVAAAVRVISEAAACLPVRIMERAEDGGAGGSGGILGGLLGGLGKLISFDGGGNTGNGARVGGVDGKGGFPAIIHPRETIIDRTKPNASGGGGRQSVHVTSDVRVTVDRDGTIKTFVEKTTQKEIGAASPAIVNEANKRVVPTMSLHQMQKAGGDYRL